MDFLAMGTLWFWLLATAWFIIVTFCIEKEESTGWGAFIASCFFLTALIVFGSREPVADLLRYAANNTWTTIGVVVLYFFFGVIWSIMKWWFFLKGDRKRQWDDLQHKNNFRKKEDKEDWKPLVPKAKDNKGTILMWMSWWPFSLLWTLIDDPIKKIFTAIFNYLEEVYDRMAERIMKEE